MSVDLYSPIPDERLQAARAQGRRARRALAERALGWPPHSPGAVNAWLLLVTTKPPAWQDDLVSWVDHPLTLGEANEGFFYPDPLGFWAEVRKWSVELFRHHHPEWGVSESLALTTLLHLGDDANRLQRALELCRPHLILFLDEAAWEHSGLAAKRVLHNIADPHREGLVYEGFWGHGDGGVTIGKAPQHPTMHNLYREEDMLAFLRSAPDPLS